MISLSLRTVGLFVVITILASAQIVPNQYIIELQGSSGAAKAGTVQPESVQPLRERVRALLEAQSVEILNTYSSLLSGFAVRMPSGGDPALDRARLEALPGVVRVHPVRLHKLLLNKALPIHAVPDAWTAIGGQSKAGAGIKIAIIDTGIDSSHPMFQDPALSMPAGFPHVTRTADMAYTNSKIIVARTYPPASTTPNANDLDSHGTAVASTAAGVSWTDPRVGIISGVAPKAWLGNYKVFPDDGSGAADNDIIQALSDALADGMDVANLSLGSDLSVPPTSDPLVVAVENAIAQGMIITIAAGNAGSDPNTIGSPAISPSALTMGASVNGHAFAASLKESNGAIIPVFPGSRTQLMGSITGLLKDVAELDSTGLACGALPSGSLNGKVALILRGVCFFDDKIATAQAAGATMMIVYTDQARPDAINMSITSSNLPAFMASYYNGVQLKALATAGGSVTVDFTTQEVAQSANSIASFSSRGPTIDANLKPDLLAVGASLVMASPGANSVTAAGTSFSSPMAAGAAALVKGARPGLTPAQYKSLLVNSARPLYLPSATAAQVTDSGAGVMQVLAAVNAGATVTPVSLSFGIGSGTDQLSQVVTITNVEGQNETFTLEPVAISGPVPKLSDSLISLGKGESRAVTVQWVSSGLTAGIYQGYIRLMGDHAIALQRIPYWYGVPSQSPGYVTFLDPPSCSRPGGSVEVDLRVTDAGGLPVTASMPTATATAGNTAAPTVAAYTYDRFSLPLPGTFAITTTAAMTGTQSFSVVAGSVTQTIDVPISSTCN